MSHIKSSITSHHNTIFIIILLIFIFSDNNFCCSWHTFNLLHLNKNSLFLHTTTQIQRSFNSLSLTVCMSVRLSLSLKFIEFSLCSIRFYFSMNWMLVHWLIVANLENQFAVVDCFVFIYFHYYPLNTYKFIYFFFGYFHRGILSYFFVVTFILLEKKALTLFLSTKFDMIESLSCVCFVCFSLMSSWWWVILFFSSSHYFSTTSMQYVCNTNYYYRQIKIRMTYQHTGLCMCVFFGPSVLRLTLCVYVCLVLSLSYTRTHTVSLAHSCTVFIYAFSYAYTQNCTCRSVLVYSLRSMRECICVYV